MIEYQILLIIAVTILQFSVSAHFLVKAVRRGELRIRFSLRALFVLVTVAAVSFGIVRLGLPWPLKCLILWGFLLCVIGLAAARRAPFPGRPAVKDR